jgi:serine protease Do
MSAYHTKRHGAPRAVVLALVLLATAACGTMSPPEGKAAKETASLTPVSYDPRVSLSPLVDKVAPAVVNIRTTAKRPSGSRFSAPNNPFEWFFGPHQGQTPPFFSPPTNPEEGERALGSGFIIDAKGLVVTNQHVVEGADQIEVQLSDDRTFAAEIVGTDERTDVALLRLRKASKLPTVSWGDSDALRVGDRVVAIGNPFGLDHTVTSGIVSAKERVIGAGPYDDFIQTDASINPGNSGGPLFDLKGEVVGVNTAINPQGQGIGFAIPSKLARTVIDSLLKQGKVVRGWLGITFQPLDEDLARAFGIDNQHGVVVSNVTSGSPADKGGVKSGDVIVAVAGRKLENPRHLPSIVAGLKPGAVTALDIIRDGKPMTVKIEIGEMPGELAGTSSGEKMATKLGFEVAPLTDEQRQALNAEKVEGVVVTDISPESPAAGVLSTGDIIVSVNRKDVKTIEAFAAATSKLGSGDNLLLRVYREGGWLYLVLKL